ncbi:Non-specific lipid-transfer protein 3 [Apostasia shenzhenica]|uniref:Non-specific lipid-transfer protein n=1 Tax=Apostasia shenzhenica TaxID=1088818 RepID=A0A2I0A8J6_9ASPA|nr:Non-specific lipid-transfer protein 3 [Apostasia shenzhenica]
MAAGVGPSAAASSMLLLLLFFSLTSVPNPATALTCEEVVTSLSGCLAYLRGAGAAPPPPTGCCAGVRHLLDAARTTPDRQQGCRCIQSILRSFSGLNLSRAAAVPGGCRVDIGYPVSLSLDCST